MNILFITGRVLPNSSQGVRYRNLLAYLCQQHNVIILSLFDYLDDSESNVKKVIIESRIKSESAPTKKGTVKSRFNLKALTKSGFKRYLEPLFFPDKNIFFVRKYKTNIRRIFNKNKINAVIIGFTPYSLYPIAKYIKAIDKSIKVILDFSDPFLMNGGLKILRFYKRNCIRPYEKHYLKYCDKIVVLNQSIKDLYSQHYQQSIQETDIHVIEQGLPKNFVKIQNKVKHQNTLRLTYIGGFYFKLREPFELYKAVQDYSNEIILDLYGNINANFLPDLNNPKFQYHGSIPQEQLVEVFEQSDLVVFLDNSYGYQVPGKTLELVALKMPVLFIYDNENSPTFHYIQNYKGFIKVKNDRKQILVALEEFNRGKFKFFYEFNLNEFTWENLAKKYNNILES